MRKLKLGTLSCCFENYADLSSGKFKLSGKSELSLAAHIVSVSNHLCHFLFNKKCLECHLDCLSLEFKLSTKYFCIYIFSIQLGYMLNLISLFQVQTIQNVNLFSCLKSSILASHFMTFSVFMWLEHSDSSHYLICDDSVTLFQSAMDKCISWDLTLCTSAQGRNMSSLRNTTDAVVIAFQRDRNSWLSEL